MLAISYLKPYNCLQKQNKKTPKRTNKKTPTKTKKKTKTKNKK